MRTIPMKRKGANARERERDPCMMMTTTVWSFPEVGRRPRRRRTGRMRRCSGKWQRKRLNEQPKRKPKQPRKAGA
jgi:hypothetical protein